jgi:type IV pilus assembly protein PilE
MNKYSAFSLIELLITMAIIGIIASWAIPSYQSFILASHRSDAKVALLSLQLKQENWRSGHNSYATLNELKIATKTENNFYTLSLIGQLDGKNFMAIATPKEAQKRDPCGVFAIDRFGAVVNGEKKYANQECWGE